MSVQPNIRYVAWGLDGVGVLTMNTSGFTMRPGGFIAQTTLRG